MATGGGMNGYSALLWLGVVCLELLPPSLLSAQEPRLRATIKAHSSAVWSMACSPDGKMVASGSLDQTIKLWDVKTGKEQATFKGHKFFVWSVAYSPDSKTVASASWDRTIKLWDVKTG